MKVTVLEKRKELEKVDSLPAIKKRLIVLAPGNDPPFNITKIHQQIQEIKQKIKDQVPSEDIMDEPLPSAPENISTSDLLIPDSDLGSSPNQNPQPENWEIPDPDFRSPRFVRNIKEGAKEDPDPSIFGISLSAYLRRRAFIRKVKKFLRREGNPELREEIITFYRESGLGYWFWTRQERMNYYHQKISSDGRENKVWVGYPAIKSGYQRKARTSESENPNIRDYYDNYLKKWVLSEEVNAQELFKTLYGENVPLPEGLTDYRNFFLEEIKRLEDRCVPFSIPQLLHMIFPLFTTLLQLMTKYGEVQFFYIIDQFAFQWSLLSLLRYVTEEYDAMDDVKYQIKKYKWLIRFFLENGTPLLLQFIRKALELEENPVHYILKQLLTKIDYDFHFSLVFRRLLCVWDIDDGLQDQRRKYLVQWWLEQIQEPLGIQIEGLESFFEKLNRDIETSSSKDLALTNEDKKTLDGKTEVSERRIELEENGVPDLSLFGKKEQSGPDLGWIGSLREEKEFLWEKLQKSRWRPCKTDVVVQQSKVRPKEVVRDGATVTLNPRLGLWANKTFHQDEAITSIEGKFLMESEIERHLLDRTMSHVTVLKKEAVPENRIRGIDGVRIPFQLLQGYGSFVNHSDEPNAQICYYQSLGWDAFILISLRSIQAEEEITVRYPDSFWLNRWYENSEEDMPVDTVLAIQELYSLDDQEKQQKDFQSHLQVIPDTIKTDRPHLLDIISLWSRDRSLFTADSTEESKRLILVSDISSEKTIDLPSEEQSLKNAIIQGKVASENKLFLELCAQKEGFFGESIADSTIREHYQAQADQNSMTLEAYWLKLTGIPKKWVDNLQVQMKNHLNLYFSLRNGISVGDSVPLTPSSKRIISNVPPSISPRFNFSAAKFREKKNQIRLHTIRRRERLGRKPLQQPVEKNKAKLIKFKVARREALLIKNGFNLKKTSSHGLLTPIPLGQTFAGVLPVPTTKAEDLSAILEEEMGLVSAHAQEEKKEESEDQKDEPSNQTSRQLESQLLTKEDPAPKGDSQTLLPTEPKEFDPNVGETEWEDISVPSLNSQNEAEEASIRETIENEVSAQLLLQDVQERMKTFQETMEEYQSSCQQKQNFLQEIKLMEEPEQLIKIEELRVLHMQVLNDATASAMSCKDDITKLLSRPQEGNLLTTDDLFSKIDTLFGLFNNSSMQLIYQLNETESMIRMNIRRKCIQQEAQKILQDSQIEREKIQRISDLILDDSQLKLTTILDQVADKIIEISDSGLDISEAQQAIRLEVKQILNQYGMRAQKQFSKINRRARFKGSPFGRTQLGKAEIRRMHSLVRGTPHRAVKKFFQILAKRKNISTAALEAKQAANEIREEEIMLLSQEAQQRAMEAEEESSHLSERAALQDQELREMTSSIQQTAVEGSSEIQQMVVDHQGMNQDLSQVRDLASQVTLGIRERSMKMLPTGDRNAISMIYSERQKDLRKLGNYMRMLQDNLPNWLLLVYMDIPIPIGALKEDIERLESEFPNLFIFYFNYGNQRAIPKHFPLVHIYHTLVAWDAPTRLQTVAFRLPQQPLEGRECKILKKFSQTSLYHMSYALDHISYFDPSYIPLKMHTCAIKPLQISDNQQEVIDGAWQRGSPTADQVLQEVWARFDVTNRQIYYGSDLKDFVSKFMLGLHPDLVAGAYTQISKRSGETWIGMLESIPTEEMNRMKQLMKNPTLLSFIDRQTFINQWERLMGQRFQPSKGARIDPLSSEIHLNDSIFERQAEQNREMPEEKLEEESPEDKPEPMDISEERNRELQEEMVIEEPPFQNMDDSLHLEMATTRTAQDPWQEIPGMLYKDVTGVDGQLTILIGLPGGGKTTTMLWLLSKQTLSTQIAKKKRYKNIWVFYGGNYSPEWAEVLGKENVEHFTDSNPFSHRKIQKIISAIEEEAKTVGLENLPKRLIIYDDVVGKINSRDDPILTSIITNSRKLNVDIWISVQALKKVLDTIIQDNCKQLFIFGMTPPRLVEVAYNEILSQQLNFKNAKAFVRWWAQSMKYKPKEVREMEQTLGGPETEEEDLLIPRRDPGVSMRGLCYIWCLEPKKVPGGLLNNFIYKAPDPKSWKRILLSPYFFPIRGLREEKQNRIKPNSAEAVFQNSQPNSDPRVDPMELDSTAEPTSIEYGPTELAPDPPVAEKTSSDSQQPEILPSRDMSNVDREWFEMDPSLNPDLPVPEPFKKLDRASVIRLPLRDSKNGEAGLETIFRGLNMGHLLAGKKRPELMEIPNYRFGNSPPKGKTWKDVLGFTTQTNHRLEKKAQTTDLPAQGRTLAPQMTFPGSHSCSVEQHFTVIGQKGQEEASFQHKSKKNRRK